MGKVLNRIFKEAQKSEKLLYKLQKEVHEEIKRSGINGDASYFWTSEQYETDDLQNGEKCVKKYGHKVWVFNLWVGGDGPEILKSKMKDGRYPVRNVALWYTPYCYNTRLTEVPMKFSAQELYNKAEKEKVLYEDYYIKVSMVRRNSIPFFKSCQWSHKMAYHEYVMYLKQNLATRKEKEIFKDISEKVLENIQKQRNGEITLEEMEQNNKVLFTKRDKLNKKTQKWVEIFHSDNLRNLFRKAGQVINDWYE